MKVHLAAISVILILGAFSVTQVYSTSSNRGINWEDMCRLADVVISEPCNDLVDSNNPYQLTREGERVLNCIGGGALALATGHPELLSLGPSVGCGGGSSYDYKSQGSSGDSDNPIGDLLNNFFRN